MKKELNRYILVEYAGIEYRECNNLFEYQELLKKIKKYNSKNNNKYLFGNVTYVIKDKKYHVTIRKYNKLINKTTISNLDELTSNYNEKELINAYKNKLKTNVDGGYEPDINIAYLNGRENKDFNFANIKVNYLPVLYRDDIKYLSKKYVMKCISYHLDTKDYGFFLNLANKFECYKIIEDDIEKLRIEVNKCRYNEYDNSYILSIVDRMYDNFVFERDKDSRVLRDSDGNILKSHRRIRDFGLFVRDYNMLERKKNSPFKYNKKIKEKYIDDIEDFDDRLQDEYAYYSWEQDNGNVCDYYQVYFDEIEKKYKRK